MGREDTDAANAVRQALENDGVDVRLGHKAARFAVEEGQKVLYAESNEGEQRFPFDQVLLALGRRARRENLGLEELGIETNASGALETNEYLQTRYPNIYACGDAAGPYQFTHAAAHQAWHAAVNALFGRFKKFKVDYRYIPWTTFTEPEVARVGVSEREAQEQELDYEVTRYGIDDLDRAMTEEADHGFVKVITARGSDRILGATIVGEHAGELITEFILAMKHGLGLNKILGTIHVYPTFSEANKFAAGEWKKAHAPEHILRWLEKFHGWLR
jgi:pyruvate/2-oxoglutarate dehydrogenase complex dihydrolipoamide dehydrogenase (E3) component